MHIYTHVRVHARVHVSAHGSFVILLILLPAPIDPCPAPLGEGWAVTGSQHGNLDRNLDRNRVQNLDRNLDRNQEQILGGVRVKQLFGIWTGAATPPEPDPGETADSPFLLVSLVSTLFCWTRDVPAALVFAQTRTHMQQDRFSPPPNSSSPPRLWKEG